MSDPFEYLKRIAERREQTVALLVEWARVSSGSRNPAGLAAMLRLLERDFGALGGEALRVSPSPAAVPGERLGDLLRIRKRPQAAVRVLLLGHMDTVAGADVGSEAIERSGGLLRGPGVADAKGGLAVMLESLRVLEESPWRDGVGWEVLINADEEIGSPGSAPLLRDAAEGCRLALVFEPALPGGALVGARKGSGTFTATVRGRAAHAGREPEKGRNAIVALARFLVQLDGLNGTVEGITVNVGRVQGGGPVNIVPDWATCTFNVRVPTAEDLMVMVETLGALAHEANEADGIALELSGGFGRPPWALNDSSVRLFEHLARCGSALGTTIPWGPSGGASDANLLAAAGTALADGLGPEGGNLHTVEEFVSLDSVMKRAELVALFLMKLGSGEIDGRAFPGK